MPNILVDTGFWIGLCDPKDNLESKDEIKNIYEKVVIHRVIIPWPVSYETLRTGFVKKRMALELFERELKSTRVELFDDAPYRQDAMELSFNSTRKGRPLSMVDCLLRLMMDDVKNRINYFVTLNVRDFADVCRKRSIELWSPWPM
jgi:predicted nucleic acid-binding protein